MVVDIITIEPKISDEDNKSVSSIVSSSSSLSSSDDECKDVVLTNPDSSEINFGNVAVSNSRDVHFGNKTYYHGPVTIKQVLYTNTHNELNGGTSLPIPKFLNGINNPNFIPDGIDQNQDENKTDNDVLNTKEKDGNPWHPLLYKKKFYVILAIILVIPAISYILITTLFGNFIEKDSANPCSRLLYQKRVIIFATLVVLIVVGIVLFESLYGSKTAMKGPTRERKRVKGPIDPAVNLTLSGKLKIIPRKEWLAQPIEEEKLPVLKFPVPYIVITQTSTEPCLYQADCTLHVRFLQTFYIESREWEDIAFNFLIGGDGFVYCGRGWDFGAANVWSEYNEKSIVIGFIGTYNKVEPSERVVNASKQLIEFGLAENYIEKGYKVLCWKDLENTEGSIPLCDKIKTIENL